MADSLSQKQNILYEVGSPDNWTSMMDMSGPQSMKGGARCQTAHGDRVKTSRNNTVNGISEINTLQVPIISGGGPKQALRRARIKQI